MKVISGNDAADFSKALNEIAPSLDIHPALKLGFNKIYAYTSDENGIRHSLLGEEGKADKHDAIFMLGSCASFITFLINKSREKGLID